MGELDWTINRSYVGTPFEAFNHLPEGLHIAMSEDDSKRPEQNGRGPNRALSMRLQRVASSELIEFPENEEGYLGKIRWYSFQFLMQELAYELEDMHVAMDNVLSYLSKTMGA